MDKRFDVVALGEAMVEFNQSDPAQARHFLQGFGGDTSNAIIAAARQGASTAYITRLGRDAFGQWLMNLWAQEGVSTEGVAFDDAGAPTGLYFVTHGPMGHEFSYARAGSAASRMRPEDLPQALIQSSRFLHVSGISQAISGSATDAVFAAIEMARAAQTLIAYDPNVRLRLWPEELARAVLMRTMPKCDWFMPSLEDLRWLSGLHDPQALLDWCHADGAPRVVLKMGGDGVWLSLNLDHLTHRQHWPSHPVQVQDATGAGDCFDGAFLSQLALTLARVQLQAQDASPLDALALADVEAALIYANAAAALTTQGFGAVEPLPRPDQVRRLLARDQAS